MNEHTADIRPATEVADLAPNTDAAIKLTRERDEPEAVKHGGLNAHHLISAAMSLEAQEELQSGLDINRTRQMKRSLRSKDVQINREAPIQEQVLEILEQGPIPMGRMSAALGIRPLALRPELKEMEDKGLIEINGDRYMLGPRWIAANPIGKVAHQLLLGSLRIGNVVAESDIASRTGLSGETIRRGMRWMEQSGEISIRYVGQKAIYDPKVSAPQQQVTTPRVGEKAPIQKVKTLWFQVPVSKKDQT